MTIQLAVHLAAVCLSLAVSSKRYNLQRSVASVCRSITCPQGINDSHKPSTRADQVYCMLGVLYTLGWCMVYCEDDRCNATDVSTQQSGMQSGVALLMAAMVSGAVMSPGHSVDN